MVDAEVRFAVLAAHEEDLVAGDGGGHVEARLVEGDGG